jgi:hypothetical protein
MGAQTTSSSAYPATHFSYFVVFQYRANGANWNQTTSELLGDFLLFANSPYGQSLLPAGYVMLTEAMRSSNVGGITQYVLKSEVVPQSGSAQAGVKLTLAAVMMTVMSALMAFLML